jgi:hypothetical protein
MEIPENENFSFDPTGLAKPGKPSGFTGTGTGLSCQEAASLVFGRFFN